MTLKAPFPWFGGKSRVAHVVWKRFGDTANFVDPFAGSLAVLLGRPFPVRTETVNDKDAFLSNFWRALQADPEAVAYHCDFPVDECSLHARHRWLVNEGPARVERLMTDPDYYDVRVAGWWVWGLCQWIGSGWCSTAQKSRPRLSTPAGMGVLRTVQKLPHVANAGRGEHRPSQQIPHLAPPVEQIDPLSVARQIGDLSSDGQGISRKMPSVGDDGRGIHRPSSPTDYLCALSERLRRVRVCCGDWTRVMGPSVTEHNGVTAVFLDPPYSHTERDDALYAVDEDVAAAVAAWARENGENPMLRIALCSYGEMPCPEGWTRINWKTPGGYGSQGQKRGRDNAKREVVDFSPHCLPERSAQMLLGVPA